MIIIISKKKYFYDVPIFIPTELVIQQKIYMTQFLKKNLLILLYKKYNNIYNFL